MKCFKSLHSNYFFGIGLLVFLASSCHNYILNNKEKVRNSSGQRILVVGKEENLHSIKVLEWVYHYGFFNEKGEEGKLPHRYDSIGDFSFYSSFVTTPGGRMMIYKITNLRTGKNYCKLIFDKTLQPLSLPIREGKEIFSFSKSPNEKAGAPLDLIYDNSIFKDQKTSYSLVINNDSVLLSLLIQKNDSFPPLLLEGTGLIGMKHPSGIYYYSFPKLPAQGKIKTDNIVHSVDGAVWYDHQWAKPLPNKKVRWTWWGITLDNGDALNLYIVRSIITGKLLFQSATRMDKSGKIYVYKKITASSHRVWKSPRTNIDYPVEWTLEIPEWGYDLHITPVWDDHEMPVLFYNYFWEGPCSVKVSAHGLNEKVQGGKGYQELVGYYYDKFKLRK